MNIEELIKNNVNLEDYLKEYGENSKFLLAYYLQDNSRITKNYYAYSKYLSNDDKLKLISSLIDALYYDAINILMADIDNIYLGDASFIPTANKIFNGLVELDKIGKIDITKITSSVFLYRSNPIYFVKKDPTIIRRLYNLDVNVLREILNYLASINYTFTESDEHFIGYCILKDAISFSFFLNNCQYDSNIEKYLSERISDLSKEDAFIIYSKIKNSNKNYIIEPLLAKLNYNNYDYQTIVKDKDICINSDVSKQEDIFKLLNEIKKNDFYANIILVMNRVDMNIVNEAEKIIGDKLKIMPLANQMHDSFDGYYSIKYQPYYDVEYIRKSEDKLNLYASMVNDTVDKDGDIKSLSPLEKYIAAYILTSKFAPYREVEAGENRYQSRSVYEFINSITNTKIVCVGYTHLLREILYRMGIKDTMEWSVKIDASSKYDSTDHSRMMVHLIDSKYGIDGIYMSDPTFDNRKDIKKEFSHMLMSHDELLEIDKDAKLDYKMLRADETMLMESGLDIQNAYKLFRKPIPKDVLIRAHLAVNHFLDKNMKMVNDGKYDFLEYCEMAESIGIYDVYQKNKERVFNELQKLSIDEIMYNYPGLFNDFFHDLLMYFKDKLQEMKIDTTFTGKFDQDKREVLFGYQFKFQTDGFENEQLTIEDINKLRAVIPISTVNKRGEAKFFIKMDNNMSINEQLDEILSKLIELNDICQNITRNNMENRVK